MKLAPFGGLANLHYAALSDIAWSADGRVLVLSSEDGFCSMVTFAEGQLGTPIVSDAPPVYTAAPLPAQASAGVPTASIATLLKAQGGGGAAPATPGVASPLGATEPASGGEGNRPAKQRRITPQLVTADATSATITARRIAPTPVTAAAAAPANGPRRIIPTLVQPGDASSTEPRRIAPTPVVGGSDSAKPRRVTPTLIAPGTSQ